MIEETCHGHSGIVAEISALKLDNRISREKMDSIMYRLNAVLSGLLVSIIMLGFNLIFK